MIIQTNLIIFKSDGQFCFNCLAIALGIHLCSYMSKSIAEIIARPHRYGKSAVAMGLFVACRLFSCVKCVNILKSAINYQYVS